MPSKYKKTEVAAGVAGVTIPPELLDQLVKGPMTPAEVQAICLSFKKALIERAMGGELSHHLGYRPGEPRPEGQDNHRNGTTGKTVLTEDGPVRIEVPRDRDGNYEPILIPKHERRFTGFDDKIIAMYARGMTVREIQGFLAEQYGTEVSPEFISSVTDEVMAEAIEVAFPQTTVQTCIVHLIRNSLDYATWKDRKVVAAALRPIYAAPTAEAAQEALATFAAGLWGQKYPTIAEGWRRAWTHVIPFFAFPPAVRRVIDTTNAIESLHRQLRKIIKTRGHFPSDEAALKLLWLALRNVLADKVRSAHDWKTAMSQFAVMYGDRFTAVRA